MSNVFSRSWEITKLSFGVIKQDKELIIYPILSSFFSILYSGAMLFPIVLNQLFSVGTENLDQIQFDIINYVLMFILYFGLAFLATFFNVCTVYTAKTRFEGGNATLGSSLKFAFSKFFTIFQWAFLSATVGVLLYILDQIAQNLEGVGRFLVIFLRGIVSIAWNIVTLFVVPALVYYDVGPFEAIRKSVDNLKKTWGESLVRHYGLGLIQFLVSFATIIIFAGISIGLFFLLNITGLLIGIGVGIMVLIIVILVFGIANNIFNTALFVYGDTGKIPGNYTSNTMKNAFREKKRPATRA